MREAEEAGEVRVAGGHAREVQARSAGRVGAQHGRTGATTDGTRARTRGLKSLGHAEQADAPRERERVERDARCVQRARHMHPALASQRRQPPKSHPFFLSTELTCSLVLLVVFFLFVVFIFVWRQKCRGFWRADGLWQRI